MIQTRVAVLALILPVLVGAHNGDVALSGPLAGVVVDGDLSDWPSEILHYPITTVSVAIPDGGPLDPAYFRFAFDEDQSRLLIALAIEDGDLVALEESTENELAQDRWSFNVDWDHLELGDDLFHTSVYPNPSVVVSTRYSDGVLVREASMQAPEMAFRDSPFLAFNICVADQDSATYVERCWGGSGDGVGGSGDLVLADGTSPSTPEILALASLLLAASIDDATKSTARKIGSQMFSAGMLLSLAILNLLIFVYRRKAIDSLFLGLAALSFLGVVYTMTEEYKGGDMAFFLAVPVSLVFTLRSLYALFYSTPPRVHLFTFIGVKRQLFPLLYWYLSCYSAIGGVILVSSWNYPTIVGALMGIGHSSFYLLVLEITRVIGQGARRDLSGGRVIAFWSFGLLVAVGVSAFLELLDPVSAGVLVLVGCAGGLAAVLARNVAQTSTRLEMEIVENERLSSENIEKERALRLRLEKELEQARELQLSMLPSQVPSSPQLRVAWRMETATQVGGDYYDYSLQDDRTLTLCVGDATGHGMDSGVVVTGTKSLFQTFADAPSITDSLTVMSKSLKGMNLPRMGMAMTLLRVTDQTCIVSSAGMPPVMIYRSETGEVEEIEVSGFPLGVSASAEYQQASFDVAAGDVILMMSDGLPERLNPRDEYFDYDRTTALFAEAASGTPEEICEALLKGGEVWAEGRPQDDDITLVVLKAR